MQKISNNKYLRQLRVYQWTKNAFIFLPLFFSGDLFNSQQYTPLILSFFAFSFVASALYILNDYRDLEDDKLHFEKSKRPLASGEIKISTALILMSVLAVSGLLIAFITNKNFFLILSGYMLMNILYSFMLKHIAIVDVTIIAIGFLMRIFSGGVITGIEISKWLVLITFLLSLFLAFAKRRDDVLIYNREGQKMRKVIDGYNIEFLNLAMILMVGIIIVSYIMYTISPEITSRVKSDKVYLSTFFVLIGLLRYLQISIVEENSSSPSKILIRDRFIQITMILWVAFFYWLIYR